MCVCVCVYSAVAPQKKYTLGKGGYIRNFVGKVLLKGRRDGIAHKNGATTEDVGTAVAQWLRCCATNRKFAGSIPDGIIEILH